MRECVEENCDVPEPPEPPCEERCAHHAREAFEECIEHGGDERRCHAMAERAMRECVEENCDVPEPPEPPCEERCAHHAREVFEDCVESGGGEDRCGEHARRVFERCVAGECAEPEPEPEPEPEIDCPGYCSSLARTLFFSCLNDTGGDLDVCARRVPRDLIQQCIELRCVDGVRVTARTCHAQCDALTREYGEYCDPRPRDPQCPQSVEDRDAVCRSFCG